MLQDNSDDGIKKQADLFMSNLEKNRLHGLEEHTEQYENDIKTNGALSKFQEKVKQLGALLDNVNKDAKHVEISEKLTETEVRASCINLLTVQLPLSL